MTGEKLYQFMCAINNQDKKTIDQEKSNFDLQQFLQDYISHCTPKGMEFLHLNYQVSLKFGFEIGILLSPEQLEVCLKYGFVPSKKQILSYLSCPEGTDESEVVEKFRLLYKYRIKISPKVILHWTYDSFIPALKYYLEHGGNPNVRPELLRERCNKKRYPEVLCGPSLIDRWYYEGRTDIVELLQKYGGKLSPYARTEKQKKEDEELEQRDRKEFVRQKKALYEKLKQELSQLEKSNGDWEEILEYRTAVEKLYWEINNADW